jgi:hypothetical protein
MSLVTFEGVSKYKSVNRAIKRGLVSPYGEVYPKRPFNNRTSKKGSRFFNDLKKQVYVQYRGYTARRIAEELQQ